MLHHFNNWIAFHAHHFTQRHIIQNIKTGDGIGELPNPTVTVEHFTDQLIGQITVWESGFMDFELLNLKTGKQILWEHRELEGQPDFNHILKEYLALLWTNGEEGSR